MSLLQIRKLFYYITGNTVMAPLPIFVLKLFKISIFYKKHKSKHP